jgi:hypothetical protein
LLILPVIFVSFIFYKPDILTLNFNQNYYWILSAIGGIALIIYTFRFHSFDNQFLDTFYKTPVKFPTKRVALNMTHNVLVTQIILILFYLLFGMYGLSILYVAITGTIIAYLGGVGVGIYLHLQKTEDR